MEKIKAEDMGRIAPLFESCNETLIWSCLEGYMGNAWADRSRNPESAQIINGDFCFFAGKPDSELVCNIPGDFPSKYAAMVPQDDGWSTLIEQEYKNRCKRILRYAIKKEPGVFDKKLLQSYIQSLPPEYTIRQIDEALYDRVLTEEWSRDFCRQFPSYADYRRYGLGFAALRGDRIVSGASSYSVYSKGIEIEIDTQRDYRRKGLALACASKLILECLSRGLYPSWDAANRASVALSEKLGYHFDREYITYAVECPE